MIMKNFLLFVLLITVMNSFSQNIKYFDENNVQLSKSEFHKKIETKKFTQIAGDSEGDIKLAAREERGKIEDVNLFYNSIQKITRKKVDFKKPIVIVYYPGSDICNSTGTSDISYIKNWYDAMEKGLNEIAAVKPFYICKTEEGLKEKNILNWSKDNGIVEKSFFLHHYMCSSFVVISPEGNYISFFGEFSKEYIWEATQILAK